MLHINEVELYFEPLKQILPHLEKYPNEPEMSKFESAFLCGLLKMSKPKKILEIGVAAGGTTAIILQCLKCLNADSKMYSVDISDKFYIDPARETGFLAKEAIERLQYKNHQFFFGGGVAKYIDKIGGDIDFAIIDTTHSLPGEVLDFLTILPYLKDDAIVCLHDIAWQQYFYDALEGHATGLLFATVSGEKYLNFVPIELNTTDEYPNIAAFKVNNETRKNIADVFTALMLRWHYVPNDEETACYCQCIAKHYDKDMLRLFDNALRLNKNSFSVAEIGQKLPYGARVLLYGAGVYGRKVYNTIRQTARHVVITQWVDKNYREINKISDLSQEEKILNALYHGGTKSQANYKDLPLASPDDIDKGLFDYIIIAITNPVTQKEILEHLLSKNIDRNKVILLRYYNNTKSL